MEKEIRYILYCHIMHYQPSEIFKIECAETFLNEIKRQLEKTDILIDNIKIEHITM